MLTQCGSGRLGDLHPHLATNSPISRSVPAFMRSEPPTVPGIPASEPTPVGAERRGLRRTSAMPAEAPASTTTRPSSTATRERGVARRQAHHDAAHAAVADEHVGAGAEDEPRQLAPQAKPHELGQLRLRARRRRRRRPVRRSSTTCSGASGSSNLHARRRKSSRSAAVVGVGEQRAAARVAS